MAIAIVTTRFTFSSAPLIADLDRVCEPNPFGRKRPKMHEIPKDLGVTPWWLPPELCRPGIYQLEFCRQGICQLAPFVQRAAHEGGPPQWLFPSRQKMQSQ
jgi:hypothetical protein